MSISPYQLGAPWPHFRGLYNNNSAQALSSAVCNSCSQSKGLGTLWQYNYNEYSRFIVTTPYSTPVIGVDGTIYVGSNDLNFYAFEAWGSLQWKFTTGFEVVSSPAIGLDGTIYIGSFDYNAYAFTPWGSVLWTFPTGYDTQSSPAIGSDGTVYFGSSDSNLYAVWPWGSLAWTFLTGSSIISSAAIGFNETVYVGSFDGNMYAIWPWGSLRWQYCTGYYIYSSPAVGLDGSIYIGSDDSNLYALHYWGSSQWKYFMGYQVESSPVIGSDRTIYVGSDDGYLYAICPWGSLNWKFATNNQVISSPAIGSTGTIYVVSDDNNLYALSMLGSLLFKFNTGSSQFSSPVIGANETIYVAAGSNLYALGSAEPVSTPSKSSDKLLIAILVGASVILILIVAIIYRYYRNKAGVDEVESEPDDKSITVTNPIVPPSDDHTSPEATLSEPLVPLTTRDRNDNASSVSISMDWNDTYSDHHLTTLTNALHRTDVIRAKYTMEQKLFWVSRLINSINELHSKNEVHGDINSENIVIHDLSFSLKLNEERFIQHSEMETKMPYYAPEILDGGEPSKEADMYAFGIVAWEILAQEIPFQRDTFDPSALNWMVHKKIRPPLAKLPYDTPPAILEMLRSCWCDKSSERMVASNSASIVNFQYDAVRTKSYDVFLSYSHQEKGFAEFIFDELHRLEYKVWLDKKDIQDINFLLEMDRGITNSTVVLACVSQAYQASEYCMLELETAHKQKKEVTLVIEKDMNNWIRQDVKDLCETGSRLYTDVSELIMNFDWANPPPEELVLELRNSDKMGTLLNHLHNLGCRRLLNQPHVT